MELFILTHDAVHTEDFWRCNAKCLESDDFCLLKALIALLASEDFSVAAIALYDVGEFARFYPRGTMFSSVGS